MEQPLVGAERLAAELLRAGLGVQFRARGQSMWPFIQDGAILHLEPLGTTPPRTGEILFCNLSGNLVLVHRLVRRLPDGRLVTWGDHQPFADRPIEPGQVLGRVVRVEQEGRSHNLTLWPWRLVGRLVACRYLAQQAFVRLGRLWHRPG